MWEDTILVFSTDNGGAVSKAGCNHPLRYPLLYRYLGTQVPTCSKVPRYSGTHMFTGTLVLRCPHVNRYLGTQVNMNTVF